MKISGLYFYLPVTFQEKINRISEVSEPYFISIKEQTAPYAMPARVVVVAIFTYTVTAFKTTLVATLLFLIFPRSEESSIEDLFEIEVLFYLTTQLLATAQTLLTSLSPWPTEIDLNAQKEMRIQLATIEYLAFLLFSLETANPYKVLLTLVAGGVASNGLARLREESSFPTTFLWSGFTFAQLKHLERLSQENPALAAALALWSAFTLYTYSGKDTLIKTAKKIHEVVYTPFTTYLTALGFYIVTSSVYQKSLSERLIFSTTLVLQGIKLTINEVSAHFREGKSLPERFIRGISALPISTGTVLVTLVGLFYLTQPNSFKDFDTTALGPIAEEIDFRWALLDGIKLIQEGGNKAYTWYWQKEPSERVLQIEKVARIWISAIAFSLAHLRNPHSSALEATVQCSVTLIGGLSSAYLKESTGSIVLPIIEHSLHNASAISKDRSFGLILTQTVLTYLAFRNS